MSDQDNFLKKRDEFTVQIRRAQREQILNKRRNLQNIPSSQHPQQQPPKPYIIIDERYRKEIEQYVNTEYDDTMFDDLVQCVNANDVLMKHRGIIGIRKLLARNVDPPIKRFIDKGLTNLCMWMAKQKDFPQIKLESAWILTNVASGQSKFCQRLVQRGAIDLFVSLLQQNEAGIVDQAIWGVGNLAADNVKMRDMILKKGGMQALTKIIQTTNNKYILRNGAWAVTNLCRGLPVPDMKYVKEASDLLCKVIKSGAFDGNNHKEILSDILWAITYMTQGAKSRIEKVNKMGVLDYIFRYANDPYKLLYIPALKIIGNFSNGNENHTDELLKHGIFDLSLKMLDHPKKQVRRQMCWILSNIAAGVAPQVSLMLERVDLLDKIGTMFHQDLSCIKLEICWIYGNLGHFGNVQRCLQVMLHYDVIRVFVHLLEEDAPEILENVLETLFKVLSLGKKCSTDNSNVLLAKFLEYGGANRLEDLQMHENKGVYNKAIKILTKFFELETNQ